MIAPESTALILLAAGKSERFGVSDKLAEDFLGQPLGFHVVTALEAIPFARRIAVVPNTGMLDYTERGYRTLVNDDPDLGMSRSVVLGIEEARGDGVEAVLIALADMPRVTAAQIYRLFDAAHGPASVVASSDGEQPRPPALFGVDRFDELERLTGNEGARELILSGRHVVTSPAELADVDTQDDVAALRLLYGQAART